MSLFFCCECRPIRPLGDHCAAGRCSGCGAYAERMMECQGESAPEWALKMADALPTALKGSEVTAVALRLVAFRAAVIEEAKRAAAEFADYCDAVAKEFGAKGDWANAESWRAMGRGAFMLRSARLDALLGHPPKEAT